MTLEEELQFKAACLLLELVDLKGVALTVAKKIISGVNGMCETLISIILERIQAKCGRHDALSYNEISTLFQSFRGQNVFEGVDSRDKLDSYMDQMEGLVKPKFVPLRMKQVLKGNLVKKIPTEWGYYIPFLPSLEKVLRCPEVLECIDNPQPHMPGVFRTALDGAFYRNHPLVKKDPTTLGIGIYTDGADMTDTASSKSGKHGLIFIYWVLFNIHPDKRSTVRSIFLLAVVKSSYLKIHGYDKILEDFVKGMNKLSSTGENFTLRNGAVRCFHGVLITSSGDNPGSANFGGYKESASFSSKPCRQCYISQEDLYKSFNESDLELRSKNRHLAEVLEVEAFKPSAATANTQSPSVRCGINRRSVLMSIEGCDVTKVLPQDVMHDVLEGTLKLDMCCTLNHVLEKKAMTLREINDRITMFSKFVGDNKPAPIDSTHLQKNKLKLTAAEAWNLAYILPFVLRKKNFLTGKMESVCDKRNQLLYILRLNVMDLLLSEEWTTDDVYRYRKLIVAHHTLFQELYPGQEIPKMHFEVHFGVHVLLFGPPRQYWCLRFEAKHAFFKRLWRTLRTLKDHAGTLSMAHQRSQCAQMLLSSRGQSGPFFNDSDCCGASVSTLLLSFPYKEAIIRSFPSMSLSDYILKYKIASINGIMYRKGCAVVTFFEKKIPHFGKIMYIVKVQQKVLFIYQRLDTGLFLKQLNAFAVKHTSDYGLIEAKKLPYNHRLPFIQSVGACYVVVPCRSYLPSQDYDLEAIDG